MLLMMTAALCTLLPACSRPAMTDEAGAIHLFNGRNLDGFYTFLRGRGRNSDPKNVFTVQDGMIRISGEEWGCLTTDDEYENYSLIAEYKWGERAWPPREDNARDSGICLHSNGQDGAYNGTWMLSIECQIIEGGTGDFIVVGNGKKEFAVTCPVAGEKCNNCYVFKPDGELKTVTGGGRVNWWGRDPDWKDVNGFRGKQDVEKPPGEWNRYECIADGSELRVILNGVMVNRATNVHPARGRIQLQSESAEIFFRRVDLIPLRKADVQVMKSGPTQNHQSSAAL